MPTRPSICIYVTTYQIIIIIIIIIIISMRNVLNLCMLGSKIFTNRGVRNA